jgi:hypothetical protein
MPFKRTIQFSSPYAMTYLSTQFIPLWRPQLPTRSYPPAKEAHHSGCFICAHTKWHQLPKEEKRYEQLPRHCIGPHNPSHPATTNFFSALFLDRDRNFGTAGILAVDINGNVVAASFPTVTDPKLVISVSAPNIARVFLVTEVDGANGFDNFTYNPVTPPAFQVRIDIKPREDPNTINPKSHGVIPVAIRTKDIFDATSVDLTTVFFGATGVEAAPVQSALEDVDGDGDIDLILHFDIQQTGVQCGQTSAFLTGKTYSGQEIVGSDAIATVGCK